MGNLTTFTIRNDYVHDILERSEEFVEVIVACCSQGRESGDWNHLRGFGNALIPQPYAHSSQSVVYIQTGNSTVRMSPHCDTVKRMAKENPDLLKKYVKEISAQMRMLRLMTKPDEKPKKKKK